MSQYKEAEIGNTVYFWFAANTTAGAAGDGASPLYDVRLAGAAAGAAPTASGTPTLLTHADYTDGLHEIAIDTTGYAAGEYAVFCTLTISTVNPAGFCGSFRLKAAGASIHSATTRVLLALPAAAADAAGGLPISDAGGLDLDAQIGTDIDAILVDTGTTLDGRIPAALTAGGNMKADVLALNGITASASNLQKSASVIIQGTVDTTAFASTTTQFEADDITEATADHYNGRIVIFTSGDLTGQATDITDYAIATGRGHFTVTALTEAPANDVTFVIV